MCPTNPCNIQEHKTLAEQVRNYPCLYDRSDKVHTEKDRIINAPRIRHEKVKKNYSNLLEFPYSFLLICTDVLFRRCYVKKIFFKISQNSQENTCTGPSFLIKLVKTVLTKPLKQRLRYKSFTVNFANSLTAPISQNIYIRLLMYVVTIMLQFYSSQKPT